MSYAQPHRKFVKHYHQPGDFHELTFSCYRRMPLLTNDRWRSWLARSIDGATEAHGFHLIAFVFMPEHVHLLIRPTRTDTTADAISKFLAAVKRPVSRQVKEHLAEAGSRLLEKLTIRNRPGSMAFRFWQEGPGYDRNLQTEKAVTASMQYIHMNPLTRQLVKDIRQWKWSSARWYTSDGEDVDPDLPTLHAPPWELYAPYCS